MISIFHLYLFLLVGMLLRRLSVIDDVGVSFLNKTLIWLFIPILTLIHLPAVNVELTIIALTISPFVIFIMAYFYWQVVPRAFSKVCSRKDEGALLITSGIGSVSFVGFPIAQMFYGDIGLAYAIIASTAGTFLVFNTLGLISTIRYSAGLGNEGSSLGRRSLFLPPFIAFCAATVMWSFDLLVPIRVINLIDPMLSTYPAFAFIAVGAQFQVDDFKSERVLLLLALLFKLLFAPLLTYVVLWYIFGLTDIIAKICVLMAGAGSMHAASVLAAEAGLNKKICRTMPSISMPISVLGLLLIGTLLEI